MAPAYEEEEEKTIQKISPTSSIPTEDPIGQQFEWRGCSYSKAQPVEYLVVP